jgi:heterodisulfide reductase subunit B
MLAVMEALGAEVEELQDWTCCGASVAPVMSDLLGLALPARNLALAESANGNRELLVGCSSCYTNFRRVDACAADPATLAKINQALEVEGLQYQHKVQVRNLMDVLANDFGADKIAARVKKPLTSLKVAPFYGCQTVRPYSPYDDAQHPTSMVKVLEALGAAVHHHTHEATCCGTALLTTKPQVGVSIVSRILDAASPADCIATVCPMCHMNLDTYQDKVGKVLGKFVNMPVFYLPQLIGLAFDLPANALMLKRHVVSAAPVLSKLASPAAVQSA